MSRSVSCRILTAATVLLCRIVTADYLSIQWIGGEFEFPNATVEQSYKECGNYVSKNIIATRTQIHDNEAFLVLPRFKPGVPATLAKTCLKAKGCQAILHPFPTWNMQEEGKCDAIQSAVDLVLEPKDTLWVLDTGIVNTLTRQVKRCRPKVVAFDVRTGERMRHIDLGHLVTNSSVLQYLIVDGSHLYISDAGTRSFIVYDVDSSRGCRVILPKAVEQGCGRRDVLYTALVRKSNGEAAVYLTYLSAKNVYSVSTTVLKSGANKSKVKLVGSKDNDGIVFLGTDNGKTIYFRFASNSDVYSWNTEKPFVAESFCVVYRSDSSCLLPTHVAVDSRLGRFRVLQSNFPDFMRNTVGCGAVQRLTLVE